MAVWAFDGWPLALFQRIEPHLPDFLRTYPGAGPDVLYAQGQQFWDDILQQVVPYDEAVLRADTVTADLLKLDEPSPGDYKGYAVTEDVYQQGQDYLAARPTQVPRPREEMGDPPVVGNIILVPFRDQPIPAVQERTPGGGIILVPRDLDQAPGSAVLDVSGGVWVVPAPPPTPPIAGQDELQGGIWIVPLGTPLPLPRGTAQPGRDGAPGQAGPPGPAGPPGVIPPELQAILTGLQTQLTNLRTHLDQTGQDQLNALTRQLGALSQATSDQASRVIGSVLAGIDALRTHGDAQAAAILDALGSDFRSLSDQLAAASRAQLTAIANVITEIEHALDATERSLAAKLTNAQTAIEGQLQKVSDDLTAQLAASTQTIVQSVDGIGAEITAQLSASTREIEGTVNSAAATITTQIGGQIDALTGGIEGAFAAAGQVVADEVKRVADAVDGFKLDPADWLGALFEFGRVAWPTWLEPLERLVEHATRGTMDSLEGDATQMVGEVLGQLATSADTPAPIKALLGQLTSEEHATGLITKIGFLLVVVHEAATLVFRQPLERWRQTLSAQLPLEIPSMAESAIARSRGLLPATEARTLANEKGFADRWADITAELSRELLSPGEIIAARLRGYLTVDQSKEQLARRGFNDADGEVLYKLATEIPTPGDLVSMLRREVFTPAISVPYGHFDEYPTQPDPVTGKTADDWFAKVGFDHDVASLFWASHWELPSNTQGFEMFQRNIITLDQLKLLLRANNIVPGWRDDLIKLAYHPLTRVDVRRMYALKVLSEEDVTRRYMDLGYDQANAEALTRFTVEQAKHAVKTDSGPFHSAIQSRAITAVVQGTVDEATAGELLNGLGFDSEHVTEFEREARVLRAAHNRGRLVAQLGHLYVSAVGPDRDTIRARMLATGTPEDAVDQELEILDVERELAADKELAKHHHELTRAEVAEAYREGLIDRPTAAADLTAAGYTAAAADTLLTLQDRRVEREQRRLDVDAVHAQYVRGAIDRAAASNQLDALKLTSRSRNAYLARWDAEKRKAPPVLSDAELRAMYVRGQLATVDARAQLLGKGLVRADVDHLLALWDADRTAALSRLSDKELGNLIQLKTIAQPEVVDVLLSRGLSQRNASRLASSFFA